MRVKITTQYLELTDPAAIRPPRQERGDVEVVRAGVPSPELNRFLYTAVGAGWYWIDRVPWTYERWLRWLDRPEVETWVAYLQGTPAGYFELEAQPEGNMEIAYFGVLPRFTGQGVGGLLLTRAARRGFERGARRVWLHTCSLDHPAALSNYKARGFRVYREDSAWKEVPERSPGPWPGARPEEE